MNREQFDNLFKIYRPIQHTEELHWLVKKVEQLHPKIILEIGTNTGGTLAFWNHILSQYCQDKRYCLLMCIDVHNKLTWDARKSRNNIKFIAGDSARKSVIDKVKYYLRGRQIDFLFIDGGHLENQVTADYINYSKFVRKGGIVAFHDIYNTIACSGVVEFWKKVKGKKDSIKFNQGIGVIWR